MRLLLVEDDSMIGESVRKGLQQDGFAVDWVQDGRAAEIALETIPYDTLLLDLGLPRKAGLDVLAALRRRGNLIPVLILTARDAVADRVKGLDAGADDYLVKPFERKELLARIRALLRRRPPRGSASIEVADLVLNPDTREVRRGEREIELTNREFELLEHLMRNQRLVVSRERLLDEVWGYDPTAATNTIDVFISNLRRKLEEGGEPRLLHTKRGAGYVLKA
jgi:DNA-binding response OmpR family regulator